MRRGLAVFLVAALLAQATVSAARLTWAELRGLPPGTEVQVSGRGDRLVVGADESTLTTLNLTDPRLPAWTKRAFRDLVKQNPTRFLTAGNWRSDYTNNTLHLTPDGDILLRDQKVGDFAQIIEHITRTDLQASGSITRKGGASFGQKAAIIGAVSGGAALLIILHMFNELAKH
jgi:hypothetical protein